MCPGQFIVYRAPRIYGRAVSIIKHNGGVFVRRSRVDEKIVSDGYLPNLGEVDTRYW